MRQPAYRIIRPLLTVMAALGLTLILCTPLASMQTGAAEKTQEKAAQDKTAHQEKPAEKGKADISAREESLRKEEERLKALRKDVDERIEKYTKLLSQIEEALKTLETGRNERMDHLVKVYEAMSAEDAAARLSAMDEPTATRILLRMKSKKAGAIMGAMEPHKAAALTEGLSKTAKKFPTK